MEMTKEDDFMTLLLAVDPGSRPMARHFHQRISILEAADKSRQMVWTVFRWLFLPGSLVAIGSIILEIIKALK